MHVMLLYDITDDRARTKIADACLDYGLDRLQYSAYVGTLSRNHQQELMLVIEEILGQHAGRICLVPIAADDWAGRLEVGDVGS